MSEPVERMCKLVHQFGGPPSINLVTLAGRELICFWGSPAAPYPVVKKTGKLRNAPQWQLDADDLRFFLRELDKERRARKKAKHGRGE